MPHAQLLNGDLQITTPNGAVFLIHVLAPNIIRVRWLPRGTTHPHMQRTWAIADDQGNCPTEGVPREQIFVTNPDPKPLMHEADGILTLQTASLRLVISPEPFCITWYDRHSRLLAADLAPISYVYHAATGRLEHTLQRTLNDEHYYGFGEKSGTLDKHSRRLRMRNTDAFGYNAEFSDPLYKHLPFYITLRGDSAEGDLRAFGLFYDTPYDCEFDLGAEIDNYYGDYRVFRVEGGDLDYYFIAGDTLAEVVEDYTGLTGRQPLVPRQMLGYIGNGMRYFEADDAQNAAAHFLRKAAAHDIRCTGFNMGSGYTRGPDGKRYVFTWAKDRIPDPTGLIRAFTDAQIAVAANVKPAMLTTHPRYQEAAQAGLFIRHAETDQPDLAPFWGGLGAHFDFTNPTTIQFWKDNLKAQVFAYGIDYVWNDNNEFNIRQDNARCVGFGTETPLAALRPLQTLLMGMASYAAMREYAPHKRPYLLTRAAAPGLQRYAVTWTGDNRTTWHTLQYNIPMGMGLGLSGFANFGHDIGGFVGETPTPELFLRWVQNGIFHPRFSINSWRLDGPEEAPWMHESVLPQVRELLRFRERLIPYLYTLLWEASTSGAPVIRPTVWHFAEDSATHTQSFEYMLGPFLLVGNVYTPESDTRLVYLPKGSGWYDFWTGDFYEGGQSIAFPSPREAWNGFPLLVREGGIIPTVQEGKYVVYAFPPQADGQTSVKLLEDDGQSLDYLSGGAPTVTLLMIRSGEDLALRSDADVRWVLPSNATWEPLNRKHGL
ncbi:MAG: glycoside hydrolase family 31 protein [Anaerolineae bacterium]